MYTGLVHTHSTLRYVLLILLLAVILKSLVAWTNKRPYQSIDNKLSLWLLIATHLQLVVGLVLYFVSPFVQFSGAAMKDHALRYWTAEHITMMIIAVALITAGRITHKKLPTDEAKHKRLFVLNLLALVVIIVALVLSGRGILGSSMMSR